jgi:hypothetical protein
MNRRALLVSLLTLFLLSLASNSLRAIGKPDVTSHEATFLGSAVNMHIEWQSPNPIVAVRISVGNKQQDIKVDPYDNKRNPSGYAGEVTVTIGLDWVPNQPFSYVIQLEDELRTKSALVTGKVRVPPLQQPQYPQYPQYPQQPGMIIQPQQPGMPIQIQPGVPQPTPQPGVQPGFQPGVQPYPQPGIQPGAQPGGQQAGTIIVIIAPQIAADSGAMWRVGNSSWKRSGEVISGLPVGLHTIEFQDISNWIKPVNLNVLIEGGETLTLNGFYNSR